MRKSRISNENGGWFFWGKKWLTVREKIYISYD